VLRPHFIQQLLNGLLKNGVDPIRGDIAQGVHDKAPLLHPGMRDGQRPVLDHPLIVKNNIKIKDSRSISDSAVDPAEPPLHFL